MAAKPKAKRKATTKKDAAKSETTEQSTEVAAQNRVTTPRRAPLGYAPTQLDIPVRDQHALEAERQAELTRERDVHNERTGDASRR